MNELAAGLPFSLWTLRIGRMPPTREAQKAQGIAGQIVTAIVASSFVNQMTGILIAGIVGIAYAANAAVAAPRVAYVAMLLIFVLVAGGLWTIFKIAKDPLSNLPPQLLAAEIREAREKGKTITEPVTEATSVPPTVVKRTKTREKTHA